MENKLIQKITPVVAAPAVAFAIQGAKFIGKAAVPVGAGFVATSCGDDGKEDPQDQDKWYADWNIDGATIEFYKGQGVSIAKWMTLWMNSQMVMLPFLLPVRKLS